jgi:CIC family chloride channel protein
VVIDEEWNYKGMISLRLINFKKEEREKTIHDHVLHVPPIDSTLNLSASLNVILEHDIDKVAILEKGKVIGYIRYRDIFEAYSQRMKQL